MKLGDVEKVRLLGQRRTKLLGDIEQIDAADAVMVEAVSPNHPGALKLSFTEPTGGAVGRFGELVGLIRNQLCREVGDIDAELKSLGVEP